MAQANLNLSAFQLRERFKTSLKREEKLQQLWRETSLLLEEQKQLTELTEQRVELLEEELEDTKKFYKKEKRKKFIQNLGLGIVVGVVGTLLLVK